MAKAGWGSVAKQMGRLFAEGTLSGLSEGQLLERFAQRRDEAAFEALLVKHGPMVLGVCRKVLGNPQDAEDAFQATFLVLARKAGSVRNGDSLAPWLHRVARRVSTRAGLANARRKDREPLSSAGEPIDRDSSRVLHPIDRAAIHEEIDRLAENDRKVLVLCDLQGLSHAEAARRLRWPVGTVKGRLSRARDRLRHRLTRRGLTLPAVGLLIFREATGAWAVPLPLQASTLRAAVAFVASRSIIAGAVPATASALAQGVLTSMFWNKIKVAAIGLVMMLGLGAGGVGVMARPGPLEDKGDQPASDQAQTSENPEIQQYLGTWRRVLPDGQPVPDPLKLTLNEDQDLETLRSDYEAARNRKEQLDRLARNPQDPALNQAKRDVEKRFLEYHEMRNSRLEQIWNDLSAVNGFNPKWKNGLRIGVEGFSLPENNVIFQSRTALGFFWGTLPDEGPMGVDGFELVLLDPSPVPQLLDPYLRDGQNRQRLTPSIIKREGNRLLICSATQGGPRPKEFKADPEAGHTLDIFELVEPEPKAKEPGPVPQDPELEKLQGDWELIGVEIDGEEVELPTTDGVFSRTYDVVIHEDRLTLPNIHRWPKNSPLYRDREMLLTPEWERGADLETLKAAVLNPIYIRGSRRLLPGALLDSETNRFEIDASQDPKAITIHLIRKSSGYTAAEFLGIYRLEGETLQLCVGGFGEPRPEVFETEPLTHQTLLTLRRKTQPEPEPEIDEIDPNTPVPGERDRQEEEELQGDWELIGVEVGGEKEELHTTDGVFSRTYDVVIHEDRLTLPNIHLWPLGSPLSRAREWPRDWPSDEDTEKMKARRSDPSFVPGSLRLLSGAQNSETNRFEIDASQDPKAITIHLIRTSTGYISAKLLGIYRLEGDTLQLCIGGFDEPRPEVFETEPLTHQTLLTLRRQFENEPEPVPNLNLVSKTMQPGDVLWIEALEALPGRPIAWECPVRSDGTISLKFYGDLYVAGLTRDEIKVNLVEHLRKFLNDETLGLVVVDPDNPKEFLTVPHAESDRVFVDDMPLSKATKAPEADQLQALEQKLDQVLRELKALKDRLPED